MNLDSLFAGRLRLDLLADRRRPDATRRRRRFRLEMVERFEERITPSVSQSHWVQLHIQHEDKLVAPFEEATLTAQDASFPVQSISTTDETVSFTLYNPYGREQSFAIGVYEVVTPDGRPLETQILASSEILVLGPFETRSCLALLRAPPRRLGPS